VDRVTIPDPMTPNRTSALATAASNPPVHGCVRCGAPVAIDVALCEDCNPIGLAQPSASQVHGTAFVGVAIAVVLLAIVARLSVSGIGPFDAQISAVAAARDGLAVTLLVTNAGSTRGSTTCRLSDPTARYGGANAFVQSPQIGPGETVTFTAEVRQLGSTPRLLTVECAAP
jgi:hypothetical protein